jgi:hypothetical protein
MMSTHIYQSNNTLSDDDDDKSEPKISQFTSQVSFSRSSDYYNQRDELDDERHRERLFQYNMYSFLYKQLKKVMVRKFFRNRSLKNYSSKNSASSSSSISSKSKHVIFADSLGMDLELIHTIQIANTQNFNLDEDCLIEFRKVTLTKQSFFSSYSEFDINLSGEKLLNSIHVRSKDLNLTLNQKTLIPRFTLSPDINYTKLVTNGICLNSVEIYNQSSIRGIILTLTKPESNTKNEYIENRKEIKKKDERSLIRQSSLRISKRLSKLFKLKPQGSSTAMVNSAKKLDLVYVIWSTDDWKSWKYHAAIQKNCKSHSKSGIIKTHEFFIQNLDLILDIDQTLQLIICHQIDMVVYKDMMDSSEEVCYNFKCAYKI